MGRVCRMKYRDKSILGFLRFPISVASTPGFKLHKRPAKGCVILEEPKKLKQMMNFKRLLNGMLKVSRLLNLAKTREEA